MTIVTDDLCRVTARMLWQSTVTMIGTFYAAMAGGPVTDGDAVADLAEWVDRVYDTMDVLLSDDLVFVDLIIDKVLPTPSHLDTVPWPTMTNGGAAGDPLPSGVAGLVSFSTQVFRRRGRKYIGGMAEAQLLGGLWTSSCLTAMATFGSEAGTTFAGVNSGELWVPVVFSVLDETVGVITASVAHAVPAYQRRRRPGVGI